MVANLATQIIPPAVAETIIEEDRADSTATAGIQAEGHTRVDQAMEIAHPEIAEAVECTVVTLCGMEIPEMVEIAHIVADDPRVDQDLTVETEEAQNARTVVATEVATVVVVDLTVVPLRGMGIPEVMVGRVGHIAEAEEEGVDTEVGDRTLDLQDMTNIYLRLFRQKRSLMYLR